MKREQREIPVAFLVECFELTESGVLLWKERPQSHFTTLRGAYRWANWLAGKPAGRLNQNGYTLINLTYQGHVRKMSAHRIVWAITYGEWPKQQIDHINRQRSDNRVANLRDVSHSENMRNTSRNTGSTSMVGAYRRARGGFRSQIKRGGKQVHLGSFATELEAHHAFLRASAQHDSPSSEA